MLKSEKLTLPPLKVSKNRRPRITLKSLDKNKIILPPAWCNSILNWETIYHQQQDFTRLLNKIEYHTTIKHKRLKSIS